MLPTNAKISRTSISSWYENYERILSNIAWTTTSSAKLTPFISINDRISLKSIITTSLVNRITPELQDILIRSSKQIQQLKSTNISIEEFTIDSDDGNIYNIQV
ncbi:unnamed protein product [Adineta steineri]|uniref:Uncharacterized protein n=1 Tax=Adineta steineri TaxID=433720 RepID=A0A815MUF2_9BILA|nr:unnamed protein product [Adineta steineri]CAF1622111.1 unnamed protein product [Adineta steineri]